MGQVEAALRVLNSRLNSALASMAQQQAQIAALMSRPRTITEEIDQIPGRRIETVLAGEVTFTATDALKNGNPVVIQVSQDGPFVMTHYPMVLWRPTAPTNATNYQNWRPVTIFPLPDQVVDADYINIGYSMADGGSQRNFQNAVRGPLFSRPDNIVPNPIPTVWGANSAIVFTPFYWNITFNGSTPPTEGTLHVDLIGYRIVNL